MKTELIIPSDTRFIYVAEQWLQATLSLELKHLDGWPQIHRRLRLALVEGYSNAVRHAHKEESSLPIVVRLEIRQNMILLEIWDQGDGYDFSQYSAPAPQERREGGYGWMILSGLVDKVQYQTDHGNGSNCLRLETHFTLGSTEPAS